MHLAARYTDFSSLSKNFVNRWVVPGDEATTNIPSFSIGKSCFLLAMEIPT